jgi:ribonuclease-3
MDEGFEPNLNELQNRIGFEVDLDLLRLAVTHRSYAYENGGIPTNERLEFLGDSVLGVVVTEALYKTYPNEPEGVLAKLRSAVVNSNALAGLATTIGIGEFLLLGRGERTTNGKEKESILADTFEAVIGATFLSHGLPAASEFVHRMLDPLIATAATLGAGLDWKTSLQELTSELGLGVPLYIIEESGPDHAKEFQAQVKLGERVFGYGEGRSKKQAEQQAASAAFEILKVETPNA